MAEGHGHRDALFYEVDPKDIAEGKYANQRSIEEL
jgi:hypothetical protein